MSRPALRPEERASVNVTIRVRKDQSERYQEAASKLGVKMSSWIRKILDAAAR